MNGITFIKNFIESPDNLFNTLKEKVKWDERMQARKTASYGKSYNYSQISYPYQDFLAELQNINGLISDEIGFEPNNCLINYYLDGKSKMGFHSDQTDILEEKTGIAIVSIGEQRILRFRNIEDKANTKDFELPSGSLIYMTQEVQNLWQHSIPKSDTDKGRMSLTFRRMR
ncbi:MAG: alpha-ketoglutarate-dependent dioxygenase AlkB [Bacteroidota bacterium]